MSLSPLLEAGAPPAAAFILLFALALDAAAGEAWGPFKRLPHPVRPLGWLIGNLDRRLNRDERSPSDRFARGALVAAFVSVLAAGVGWAITALAAVLPFGWLMDLALVTALLAQRSLYRHVGAVADALEGGGLDAGRAAVGHIVGRDTARLDGAGVARAAIESCAENFSDGVIAPAFWYLVLGLPGMLAYKAVNTMDSMIGHRTPRHQAFGAAAARLDDLLNLAPARAAALMIALAALAVPRATPGAALRIAWRDAGKHRSPNAGWPEAAMAGALDLALAGPRRYGTELIDDPWLGAGTAQATAKDIRRALAVLVTACLINALAVLAVAVVGSAL
jgi:adenosylcobinamide-phosphate synthase